MRHFIVSLYLVKAAELDVIRTTAIKLLRGLHFTTVYTPSFAMCADNQSEIMLTADVEVGETKSTLRFSNRGLCAKQEMREMHEQMIKLCQDTPQTIDLWREEKPDFCTTVFYTKAAIKAKEALRDTFKELSRKTGNRFDIMVINNDLLPLLELSVPKDFEDLQIAQPGDVIQFRYEVAIGDGGKINFRLLHAYRYK
jgi:hypothetical protein